MSYLFYIDKYDNKILRPECLKLCEELRVLSHEEVTAIIYAYDYHSIYRQFPESERKRKAVIKVYGTDKSNFFESTKIQSAVEAYMSLQYNPKIELIKTYQGTINALQKELPQAKDEKDISRILKSVEMLNKNINTLDNEVSDDVAKEGVVMGGDSLSYIEILQENKGLYDSILRGGKK